MMNHITNFRADELANKVVDYLLSAYELVQL